MVVIPPPLFIPLVVAVRCCCCCCCFLPIAIRAFNDLCTADSDSASSDAVASSKMSSRGERRTAREIATRWRWPPLSREPFSPTLASKPPGIEEIKSKACARFAACSTAAREGGGDTPRAMFSRIDRSRSTHSWSTKPMLRRRSLTFKVFKSRPPIEMLP